MLFSQVNIDHTFIASSSMTICPELNFYFSDKMSLTMNQNLYR